jgi:hypothetical protein
MVILHPHVQEGNWRQIWISFLIVLVVFLLFGGGGYWDIGGGDNNDLYLPAN